MYIIKSPTEKDIIIKGNYPYQYILDRLLEGKHLVVVSTYSNTIKVPSLKYDNGEVYIESFEVNLN